MGQIAFVFSGQGAQAAGMGRELYDSVPESREVLDRLERLRPGTLEMCFSGTAEQLAETRNTQPAMYAMETAAAAALNARGVFADCAAGFSLGEIGALAHAGYVSAEEGFRLVALRGELMQRDAERVDGAMAAVVKLSAEQVETLAARFEHVYPVNYNCPGQISVSGLRGELQAFSAAVKEAGGRALPLKVRSCFHSPYMSDAAQAFHAALGEMKFAAPQMPLYSNLTGKVYDESPIQLLSKQITHPVRWQTILENMIASGVDRFIEVGPGKTLCGFVARTNSIVRAFHVENIQSLNEAVEGVKSC